VTDLQGTWKLVEVNSHAVRPSAATALLLFTIMDESIEGFDGCNDFWGRLDQPGTVSSTRRGCPDDVLKLPLDLSDPMSHLKSGQIEQGRLILPQRNAIPAAVFEHSN
jgi:heat shock protein HslJ